MPPSTFGRYEVVCEIGEGAMGRVYRALDPMVGRPVAIKTIKSEYLTKDNAAEYIKRFRREAQAAGVLTHPNIVSIFDVGDGFLVMEYLEGQTLEKILSEKGRLEAEEVLRILTPVAEALDHAHQAGIIHRDIKPANVMILKDGRPKLMDFGVAHFEASLMTTTGQVLGSPSYMAPELIAGAELTPRADVYSLAVVAYEALTGHRPFQGTSITSIIYKVMSEVPPPPRKFNAELPRHYDEVFEKALAKDPAVRYPSTTAMMTALALREYDVTLAGVLQPEELPTLIVSSSQAAPRTAEVTAESAVPRDEMKTQETRALRTDEMTTRETPASRAEGSTPPEVPLPRTEEITAPEIPAAPAKRDTAAGLTPRFGRRGPWLGAAAAGVVLAGVGIVLLRRTSPPGPTPTPEPPRVVAASTPSPDAPPVESTPVAEPTPPPAAPSPEPATPAPTPRATPRPARPRPTPKPRLVEGMLVELTPDVTPPRRISGDPARFPERARLKESATVVVSFIVDAKGEPTELTVVESGGEILDQAVLDAVRRWRYEPAQKDGVRVSVRQTLRQVFKK